MERVRIETPPPHDREQSPKSLHALCRQSPAAGEGANETNGVDDKASPTTSALTTPAAAGKTSGC